MLKKIIFFIFLFTLTADSKDSKSKVRCYDKDSRCKEWANHGDCGSKEVKDICRRSCKRCAPTDSDFVYEAINKSVNQTYRLIYGIIVFVIFGIVVLAIKLRNIGVACVAKGNLKGKIVVITGATSGIGYETAFRYALRGAHLVLGCSKLKRGFKIANSLRKYTGQCMIEVRKLDLSSFDSVHEFADDINQTYADVHILVNNAATIPGKKRQETVDKNELSLQVNYLSHVLLAKLLISKLKQTLDSRIINVVCDDYKKGEIDFEDFQLNKNFHYKKAYQNSKLALMLFTIKLSKLFNPKKISVNAVDPGKTMTMLWRNLFPLNWRIARYAFELYTYVFWRTNAQAAETMLYCAVEKQLETESGKLFKDCEEVPVTGYSDELMETLWDVTEKLLIEHKPHNLTNETVHGQKIVNETVVDDQSTRCDTGQNGPSYVTNVTMLTKSEDKKNN